MVQKGLLDFFVAYYFSQRQPRVSQSVNAGCCWRGKYFIASRGKKRRIEHRRVTKDNYMFEYLWNLDWWQNATRVSLKKSASKKLIYDPSDVRISVSNKRQV